MFENLRRDAARYNGEWYRRSGFWIVAVYRFGNWADSMHSLLLRAPLWALYFCLKMVLGLFSSNFFLWAGRRGAHIGPGLRLMHAFNVIIDRRVEIGEDCTIYHEVTLGTGQIPGAPKIGNHVAIYPGARLLGGIEIGNNVMIGANCVVTKNVPPDSIIVAAPSRAIPQSLSTQARRWDADKKPLRPLSEEPNTQPIEG